MNDFFSFIKHLFYLSIDFHVTLFLRVTSISLRTTLLMSILEGDSIMIKLLVKLLYQPLTQQL